MTVGLENNQVSFGKHDKPGQEMIMSAEQVVAERSLGNYGLYKRVDPAGEAAAVPPEVRDTRFRVHGVNDVALSTFNQRDKKFIYPLTGYDQRGVYPYDRLPSLQPSKSHPILDLSCRPVHFHSFKT